MGGFTIFNGNSLDFYKEELPRFIILSRNVLNYLKEGKTLEESCAKVGVVSNGLNIWKLWVDKDYNLMRTSLEKFKSIDDIFSFVKLWFNELN